jgi:hypothetical protein
MVPPIDGFVFDPDTIAVLTAAYEDAIKGQSTTAREIIAKHIIELASEGERDPYKLCQGALALSMRRPHAWHDARIDAWVAAISTSDAA